jgi:hypothetical protein
MMPVKEKVRRKKSERGNWLVVTYHKGKITFCTWVQTWAGVQMSKRNAERNKEWYEAHGVPVRVMVLDIERMVDYAVTEGYNEIVDLERLLEKEQ